MATYTEKFKSVAAAYRGASIEFRQRISRGERELVTAKVLVAAIRDGRPARIPPALRRLFEAPGDEGGVVRANR